MLPFFPCFFSEDEDWLLGQGAAVDAGSDPVLQRAKASPGRVCQRILWGLFSGRLAKQSWELGHCVRAWSLAPETCLLSHLEEIVTDLVL